METLEAIKTRRSIRDFLKKDVNKKLLHKIIEAGERAPSSKNTRPRDFLILKGKAKDAIVDIVQTYESKRKKIYRKGKKTKSSILPSCELTKKAPVLILIFNKAPYTCGEKNVIKECDYESMLARTVEVQGVSAAIQNMLLAIHDLDLGGVWLADFNFARKEIGKHLHCKYDLLAGIALGHPSYSVPPRKLPKIDIKIIK